MNTALFAFLEQNWMWVWSSARFALALAFALADLGFQLAKRSGLLCSQRIVSSGLLCSQR